jgi:hypothetical protein
MMTSIEPYMGEVFNLIWLFVGLAVGYYIGRHRPDLF